MSGLHIGKIFGIDIRIDWSWLLIFALVTWSLFGAFQDIHPEWNTSMQWGLAALGALLFFISVLAHELAHSLVARARRLPVKNITLFLFGGVSNIQREPTSALDELLIAIVGPLTSFLLGGLFLILGIGSVAFGDYYLTDSSRLFSQFGPINTVFVWLGSVNILLGLFNLVPGFPLDGGRVLRSILWGLSNNLVKATRWASIVGQVVAWTLILAGVAVLFGVEVPFLAGGIVNGMWLIFIGWFLQTAAVQSYRRIVIQDILEDVPVKRIMNTNVPVVSADTSVETLIDKHIMQTDNQAFIVYDQDRMIGMVALDNVRGLPIEARRRTMVRDIMTPSKQLIVIAPEENASDALDRLQDQEVPQLPVVTGNRIVGLLRRRDILRWLDLQSQAR